MSLTDFEQVLYHLPLDFDPGEGQMYSNTGYFFLGKIIEKITGESYSENIKRRIFVPLEMADSGVHYSQDVIEKMATSYQFRKEGSFRETVINRNLFRAAGDLYSTVNDLFRFEQALYSDRLLNAESKKVLFAENKRYGWIFSSIKLGEEEGMSLMSYSGQLLEYNSMLTRFPDSRSSVILLGNIGTSEYERSMLTREIARVLFDAEKPNSKLRASTYLHKAIYQGRLAQALSYLEVHKSSFEIDKDGLKSLVQQLSWAGLSADTLAISQNF